MGLTGWLGTKQEPMTHPTPFICFPADKSKSVHANLSLHQPHGSLAIFVQKAKSISLMSESNITLQREGFKRDTKTETESRRPELGGESCTGWKASSYNHFLVSQQWVEAGGFVRDLMCDGWHCPHSSGILQGQSASLLFTSNLEYSTAHFQPLKDKVLLIRRETIQTGFRLQSQKPARQVCVCLHPHVPPHCISTATCAYAHG